MGLLVSIDNGGTLTDVCATDGVSTIHAKTLTTPHNLTECFVKCLEALSEKIDGEVDLPKLVGSIDYIRYSTTQGTNAIVQRKGPRIGVLTDDDKLVAAAMNAAPKASLKASSPTASASSRRRLPRRQRAAPANS